MRYFIIGNSYPIREDLKAWACSWDQKRKCWVTPTMEKDEIMYKRIKSICESFGLDLVPERSKHEHISKIQEILNGIK